MSGVRLTLAAALDRVHFELEAAPKVYLDHVRVEPLPKRLLLEDKVVVFRADKLVPERLMTPEAHFYGRTAYGVLRRKGGRPVRAKDVRPTLDARRMTLVLCTADGGPLPARSDEMFPSGRQAVVPVSLATFRGLEYAQWAHLVPDPDRIDVRTTPRDQWIYAEGGKPGDPHGVSLVVLDKPKDFKCSDGRTLKRAVLGPLLAHKVVVPPTQRAAGALAGAGSLREIAIVGTDGKSIRVRTRRKVLAGHDFAFGQDRIRVAAIDDDGFVGHRLCR